MHCNNESLVFSQTDALSNFNKLKLGKAADPDGIFAKCLKYANLLLSYINKLIFFTACSKHGVVLCDFCGGRITLIPKTNSNSNFSDSRPDNERLMFFAKVYEYCFLGEIEYLISFDDLQMFCAW